jgi:hypothetical protein
MSRLPHVFDRACYKTFAHRFTLDHTSPWAVDKWLDGYPELRQLYVPREASTSPSRGVAKRSPQNTRCNPLK